MLIEDKLDHLLSINTDAEKEDLKLEFNRYCLNKDCYRCNEEDGKLIKAFCLLDWITDNYKIEKRRN